MYFLKNYYQSVIQYDLVNKFQYENLQNLPKLQKIVLNFQHKDFKNLASSLL
jgi:ribosomal protein L5